MLDHSITDHLGKYFDLAINHFVNDDSALAVFFAITLIEECAKILYLRDANLKDKEGRRAAIDHGEKHFLALVNLLSASDRFDALPKQWQDEAWSLFQTKQAMRQRNDSLYLRFDKRGRLMAPNQVITADHATLLVYLSGFVVYELKEFVDIEQSWAESILKRAEVFRAQYLKA